MADETRRPAPLPEPRTSGGASRRVGIELEFGGLTALEAARTVAQVLGGRPHEQDRHHAGVEDSRFGDIAVELDTRWAKPDFLRAIAPELPPDLPEDIRIRIEALPETAGGLIGDVLDLWLPIEVITPPIAHEAVCEMVPLCTALHDAGATGTRKSVFGGFGLHLNPEAAHLDAAYLKGVLAAYLLLSGHLREEVGISLVRSLGHFVDPFPDDYIALVTAEGYAPDLAGLIGDYISANPTRNRELDMLPVFAHLDEARVRAALPDEKINARPAFHYRLPNCRLDEPGWSPLDEWDRWVMVERLAADAGLRAAAADAWRRDGALPSRLIDRLRSC